MKKIRIHKNQRKTENRNEISEDGMESGAIVEMISIWDLRSSRVEFSGEI